MRDVLRHQRFIDGRISTKFIAEEYPEGFQGITLSQQERNDLVATAAILHMQRCVRHARGRVHTVRGRHHTR